MVPAARDTPMNKIGTSLCSCVTYISPRTFPQYLKPRFWMLNGLCLLPTVDPAFSPCLLRKQDRMVNSRFLAQKLCPTVINVWFPRV